MKYTAVTYLDSTNLDRAPQPSIAAAIEWITIQRKLHPLACHSIYLVMGSQLIAQWELGKLTVNRATGHNRKLIEATQ